MLWLSKAINRNAQGLANEIMSHAQNHVLAIESWTKKIKSKYQVNIHLNWVPGHMNIIGNEKADQAAKKGTELQKKVLKSTCLSPLLKER